MIRATTGGVMKTYRSNLMGSFINMNNNRNTVLTQRTFNSYAEDPAAAARAFRLRKSRMTVESQYNICNDVLRKYDSAVACLQSIDDVLCTKDGVYGQYMNTLTGTTLKMLNDPTGDAREQLSKVLDQMSQDIIQAMNQKYGDNFIFAGADGHNVPFEIRDDGKLYYRGVSVDAAIPNVWRDASDPDNIKYFKLTDGKYDPNGTDYLDMSKVQVITQAEYERLYVLPEVQKCADLKVDTDQVYDKEGNPIENSPDAAGYYQILGEDGTPTGEMISIEDYHADLNFDQPIEYNADGTIRDSFDPAQEGGWYMITDGDKKGQLIKKQEYSEIQYRQKYNPILGGDGNPLSVNVNGDPTADPDSLNCYLIYSGDEPPVITEEDYNAAIVEYEKLKYLAEEKYFVDIGYGFQEVDGKLIESSAFNASLNGINFMGWGLDEDGDPKNLYSLVQKMKDVANNAGESWSDETWTEFDRLVGKFEKAVSNYQTEFVNLDASTGKLSTQSELLEENFYNLQEQYSDLEDVDMVDAITSFIWAEYCYNAALKVGNSILGQSLMDYLS